MAGRYVTNIVRNMIVVMRLIGLLLSEITILVVRSKSTISRIIKNCHEHGSIELPKRSRRPQKLKDGDRRILRRDLLNDHCAPFSKIS